MIRRVELRDCFDPLQRSVFTARIKARDLSGHAPTDRGSASVRHHEAQFAQTSLTSLLAHQISFRGAVSRLWNDSGQPKSRCRTVKSSILSPQTSIGIQPNRSEQVSIDITNAASEQTIRFDEVQNLGICGDMCQRQVRKRIEHDWALPKVTKSDFANNEGMRQHHPLVQQICERLIAVAKMVHPN